MARRKKLKRGGGASWLETYSDMVTLLLTFFIMLYAMSTIDAAKYAAIVASFSKQMNPEVYYTQGSPSDREGESEAVEMNDDEEESDELDALYSLLKQYVDENNLTEQVEISKTKEYVFIRFSDAVTFRGYSDVLEQSGRDILDVLAQGLVLVDEYVEEVIIAGHTAEVEYDKTDIDRSLSTDRANVVLKYLEDKDVISPAKYLAIGYGLYSPIADNSTPEGRAKNRRVEIYISRAGYPISYTKKIQETINSNDQSDENIEYKKNSYIN
ncbi:MULTISPECIES: OmpA/MotB family protein [unclassified Sedimentibacter]|uniref:OmpA/MotB family protein n=1 Tax=unclassified Sedimentibacter TaxID=2649220 RepID=UPI0027DF0946|nr:flagellar motor protein MotB [Sedimentibacter sp. MB35-C1]WMJ78606.1 flagellar motor protein MotB [Sedimentibacter sp. MB35-C1]